MKKIIALILCLLIFIIALPINAFALSSSNRDNSISTEVVDEGQEAKPFTNHFSSYTFDNIDGFKRYLKAVNINMDTTEGFFYIAENYSTLYNDALSNGYITYYPNDVLLADGNVVVEGVENTANTRWSSDDSTDGFGAANDHTHQVITKEALSAVQSYFPGFFKKSSSGEYITQLYADYPDVYEKLFAYGPHFYNYETGLNYWGNSDNTAKSRFYEHYNNAKNYYETNHIYALQELGAALHYLEDLGAPVHVGDGYTIAPWWTELVLGAPDGFVLMVLYGGDMFLLHKAFEDYVDTIDQDASCAIPSYVNYDYYVENDLEYILNELIEHSYSYYDEARGNDSEKYTAAINTIPYTKKTVAGILYKFATEVSGMSQYDYDGILIRNKASNNYFTQSGTNIQLAAFNGSDSQRFTMWEYTFVNDLNHQNRIVKTSDNSYITTVGSSAENANVYLAASTTDSTQRFRPEYINGSYKILTAVSNYEKVIAANSAEADVGDNICQKTYSGATSDQWYFDLMKNITIDPQSSNLQSPYIKKGQWIYYKVQVSTAHYFRIETYSPYDTYLEVVNSSLSPLGTPSTFDDAGNGYNARAYVYMNPGTYFIKLRMYSSSVEGKVNLAIVPTDTREVPSIGVGAQDITLSRGSIRYFQYIPGTHGQTVITTEGSQDTYLFLCDENMNVITTNDDINTSNRNARIQYQLTYGETYYIGVRFYSTATVGTFTLKIFENTLPDIPIQ